MGRSNLIRPQRLRLANGVTKPLIETPPRPLPLRLAGSAKPAQPRTSLLRYAKNTEALPCSPKSKIATDIQRIG